MSHGHMVTTVLETPVPCIPSQRAFLPVLLPEDGETPSRT